MSAAQRSGGGGAGAGAAEEQELFEEGEEVLAFFGHQLFSGTILLVDESKAPHKYLVHYHGWNSRYI